MSKSEKAYSRYKVWANDELSNCGSGQRIVRAKVGRKWVKVKPCVPEEAQARRIPIKVWQQILQS